jgi:hypothetical protein
MFADTPKWSDNCVNLWPVTTNSSILTESCKTLSWFLSIKLLG